MKRILLLATCGLAASVRASLYIPTVVVGDVGNPADPTTGYGQVNYQYHIGTYEVTNTQYTAFLNAVDPLGGNANRVYNSNMGSNFHGGIQYNAGAAAGGKYTVKVGMGSKPVNFVTFWDAARFTNWLTSGNTETGVYNLGAVTNPSNDTITRDATAWAVGGVAIASENEWYKAAYYSGAPTGGNGGYWRYPIQSNSITPSSANYGDSVGSVTDVGSYSNSDDPGSYSADSNYGTFDQGGNVWEWNEDIPRSGLRGLRGGSFGSSGTTLLSSRSGGVRPGFIDVYLGFRVTSLQPIPEPSISAAVLCGLVLVIAIVRRRGR